MIMLVRIKTTSKRCCRMWKRENGYYEKEKKKYVSVTTFLKIINKEFLNAWRANVGTIEAMRISGEAADVGKEFHSAVEAYLKHPLEKYPYKTKNAEKMFNVWFDWWQSKVSLEERYTAQPERIVFSELFGYAGQLDCDTNKRILDWKTSKRIYDDYILQAHAYSFASAEEKARDAFPSIGNRELLDIIRTNTAYQPKPIQIFRIDKEEPFKMQLKPRKEPMPFDWYQFDILICALKLWRWQNEKPGKDDDGVE